MVSPVQRPRGPEGYLPRYMGLPWPSDVTTEQRIEWHAAFMAGIGYKGAPPIKPPEPEKFWVVAPDRVEPLTIEADTMDLSADAQTIMLLRNGVLVASMPATYFCVKAETLTVHK